MKMRYSQNGTHLFDRRTGLNVLIDDRLPPDRSEAPAYTSIALTNACDLKCPYCYAPKHAAKLTASDVLGWATELDAHGCLGLGLGGGEPTLFPEFSQLCRAIANRTELAVTITTHGHRLTQQLIEELTGAVHFIRISMDGVGTTYERLRGRSFNQFRTALERLAPVIPFGINYVVNGDTLPELDSAAVLVKELGARQLLLLPEVRAGTSVLAPEHRRSLSEWVRINYKRLPLAISVQGIEGVKVPRLFPCGAEPEMAHINADGELKQNAFAADGVCLKSAGSFMAGYRRMKALPRSYTIQQEHP